MGAHPDGTGEGWSACEAVDVDRPHGLDYRFVTHVAKAVRKRMGKEHVTFADATVGGEHVPGYCKVLKHVDGTADVSGAQDATLFQNSGMVHSAAQQTLWCITGAASDPTVLLMHPSKQFKGGDITWAGAAEFDQSADFTGPIHVDGSTELHGPADLSDTIIDGTLNVLDRADFSAASFSGDVTFASNVTHTGDTTFSGRVQVDGTWAFNGDGRLIGDVTVFGLMTFCANNLYDSTWFNCEKGTAYALTHDLSSTALQTMLWFKDIYNQTTLGANRIYECHANYEAGNEQGGHIGNLTTTQLTVQAGANHVALTYNATGNAAACTSGQYRVIAMRLV